MVSAELRRDRSRRTRGVTVKGTDKKAIQNDDRSWECRRVIYQGLNYCPLFGDPGRLAGCFHTRMYTKHLYLYLYILLSVAVICT